MTFFRGNRVRQHNMMLRSHTDVFICLLNRTQVGSQDNISASLPVILAGESSRQLRGLSSPMGEHLSACAPGPGMNDMSPPYYDAHGACHTIQPREKLCRRIAAIFAAAAVLACILTLWPFLFMSNFVSPLTARGYEWQLETVRYYDLSNMQGSARGWEREERILLCIPLRDAESHLPMFFSHLRNLTYPHQLIDLAFLVSDSQDKTLERLSHMLRALQADPDPEQPYGEVSIIEKDFGQKVNQDVESRHGFAAQASRRKLMAQARNWLLTVALRPHHSWVYWRDVDVETAPFTILEDLMRHNKDVIVPSKSHEPSR
jgi:mannan polymerase II complex ANP1 subunit